MKGGRLDVYLFGRNFLGRIFCGYGLYCSKFKSGATWPARILFLEKNLSVVPARDKKMAGEGQNPSLHLPSFPHFFQR